MAKKVPQPLVGIIMGSDSDLPVMKAATQVLADFGVPFEVRIVSAHRTPQFMLEYAQSAEDRGIQVIIAGAGGAAHLPGMVASATHLPVIGVPVQVGKLNGLDALLSIAQMPKGVPVATMSVDNAFNAGLFAARILGLRDERIERKLKQFMKKQEKKVRKADQVVRSKNRKTGLFARALATAALTLSTLAGGLFTESASASVWETQMEWTPEWEHRYEDWVKTDWHKDFFNVPGPFQGLLLDCADAVYAMRFIYAYLNGLPFAINDPTGGPAIISNNMRRWDRLPEEQRVRAFLVYIFNMVSTQGLIADSYPVALRRDSLHAGIFLRSDAENHHSWTVRNVSATGIPALLFATRPASSRLYERNEYPSMGFLFAGSNDPGRGAGFRMFRYRYDLKLPEWEVPGYSLEQYQIPLEKWAATVQSYVAITKETHQERVDRLLTDACRSARERVDFVNQALVYLEGMDQAGQDCMSSMEFDDYSTPSRDRRLLDSFQALASAYRRAVKAGAALDSEMTANVKQIMQGEESGSLGANAYCTVEYYPGYYLTPGQIYARAKAKQLSSNPHDPLLLRWGFEMGPSDRAARCPVY